MHTQFKSLRQCFFLGNYVVWNSAMKIFFVSSILPKLFVRDRCSKP